MLEQIFSIDFQPDGQAPGVLITGVQGDVGRIYKGFMYCGGQPYIAAAGDTLRFEMKKPDGHIIQIDVPFSNTREAFQFASTEQMTVVPGNSYCTLSLVDSGGNNIHTKTFYWNILPGAIDNGDPSGSYAVSIKEALDGTVGELTELATTIKSDTVAAINEVLSDANYAKETADATAAAVDGMQTVVSGLQSSVQGLSVDVSNLQTDVQGISSNVSTNAANIAATNTRVDTLSGTVSQATADIDALETNVSELDTTIEGVQADVSTNAGSISSLQTTSAEHTTDISGLDTRVTAAEGNITAQDARLTTAEGDISGFNTRVSLLATRVSNAEANIGNLNDLTTTDNTSLVAAINEVNAGGGGGGGGFTPASNAGAHNAIYRGKNLGTEVTAAQYAAIAAGTFEDLFIGDYWVIGGIEWLIAAFDYYFGLGDVACNTHHVVIVPRTCLGETKQMHNAAGTTMYGQSTMFSTGLDDARTIVVSAFGQDHVLVHRQRYATSAGQSTAPTAAWGDVDLILMTQANITGASPLRDRAEVSSSTSKPTLISDLSPSELDITQFPLFRFNPGALSREDYWLRDMIMTYGRYIVSKADGTLSSLVCTYKFGVRPSFCICAASE